MRITFDKTCLALAACLVGIGAQTAPLGSSYAPPIGQSEGPTKRHMRVHEPTRVSEEDRGPVLLFGMELENVASNVASKKHTFDESNAEATSSSEWKPEAKTLNDILDEPLTDVERAMVKVRAESISRAGGQNVNFVDTADAIDQAKLQQTLDDADGDEVWAKILAFADEKTAPIASTPESLMRDNADPNVVLSAIYRTSENKNLFSDTDLMEEWIKYVDKFNELYPLKAKPLLHWLSKFNKKLVDMLYSGVQSPPRQEPVRKKVLDLIIDSWHVQKLSPKKVFYLLGLDKGTLHFGGLRFTEWMHYAADFSKENHLNTKVLYSSALMSIYSKEELRVMLKHAPPTRRTKRVVLDLKKHLRDKKLIKKNTKLNAALKWLKETIKGNPEGRSDTDGRRKEKKQRIE